MIKPLIHGPILLARKSAPASKEDQPAAADLLDTLRAHEETCVGMAANMIGVYKNIIAFRDGDRYEVMFNPEIVKRSGAYSTREGCLSLPGDPRETTRYRIVKVRWQNEHFETRIRTFSDFTAQIIQHEIDHCNGILI